MEFNQSIEFRNKILPLFFSTLKKHSIWEALIEEIKKLAFEVKEINLWKSKEKAKVFKPQFNTQFLLHYMLNCNNVELNV